MNHSFSKPDKLYLILTCIFCVVVNISNLITSKLVPVPFNPHLALPAGLITYPITFYISDLVTEIYGGAKARWMVYLGFSMAILTYLIIKFTLIIPYHSRGNQEAFNTVFGMSGLVILSSMAAYIICQLLDVYFYTFFYQLTKGKHLWLRTNGSKLISQLLDTIIVTFTLSYWGFQMELASIFQMIGFAYLYKAIISVCNTPFFYLAVRLAEKYLKEDTSISPSSASYFPKMITNVAQDV